MPGQLANKYELCYYVYNPKNGMSNMPFYMYKPNDNTTSLSMIRDLHFSFKAKNDELIKLKFYSIHKLPGRIYKTTNTVVNNRDKSIKSFIKLGIYPRDEEGFIEYNFDNNSYKLILYQHRLNNEELFISNPELLIKDDCLINLLQCCK